LKFWKITRSKVFSCSWKISWVGNGNQRELVLRAVGIVARRSEDEEADQVDVGILLQELPEEADVPGRAPHDQKDADAVPDHLRTNDRELFWAIASPS